MSKPNAGVGECSSSVRASRTRMYPTTGAAANDVDDSKSSENQGAPSSRGGRSSRAPLGVGGAARLEGADLFDAVLNERWEHGDDSVSNRAIADRYLRIDEKQVRQYRDARKLLPFAALLILPVPVVAELCTRVLAARGIVQREGAAMVRHGIDRIAKSLSKENAPEVRRLIRELQRQLLELDAKVDEVR